MNVINGLTRALGVLILGLMMAAVALFILLNLMVGCETWEDPACITPTELVEMFNG